MATMTAKYRGRCAISGAAILPRDVVRMPLVAVVAQFKRGKHHADSFRIYRRNLCFLCNVGISLRFTILLMEIRHGLSKRIS